MRLLLTTDTVGGVWTFTKDLAGALIQRGCEVTLVSFGRLPTPAQASTAEQLSQTGRFNYFAYAVPLEWMQENTLVYEAGAALLLELCQQVRPDVLLLSQFCFGALPVDIPKVVIAHSDVLSWAEAVGKAPLAEDDWLQTYRLLVQRGLTGADVLVAPTAAALAGMAPHYCLPGRTAVVLNGRSLPPQRGEERFRHLRAITAGRMWDPAKNLALLCDSVLPIPVLVAGENDLSAADVRQLTMLGQKTEQELVELLLGSAIYICCSVYEPFGLAPLEAALCGCAILVEDVPSLREVWGSSALYFHDSMTLAGVLQSLVDDPTALQEAQRSASAHAKKFTADAMADNYLALCVSLVNNRSGRQARAA